MIANMTKNPIGSGFLLGTIIFLAPYVCFAAVAYDNQCENSGDVSTLSCTMTTAGADEKVIFFSRDYNSSVVSADVDAIGAHLIGTVNDITMFYADVSAGSHTFNVNRSNSGTGFGQRLCVVSYNGLDSGGPDDSNVFSASTNALASGLTSAFNGSLFVVGPWNTTTGVASSITNGTMEGTNTVITCGDNISVAAGSYTLTSNFGSSAPSYAVAAVFAPVGSHTTPTATTSTSTIQQIDNANQDMYYLLVLFSVWFFGFYWIFSKKR